MFKLQYDEKMDQERTLTYFYPQQQLQPPRRECRTGGTRTSRTHGFQTQTARH